MVAPPASEPAAIELWVSADEAGERLDRVLSARPLGYSRSAVQDFIALGRVLLDGRAARASTRVAKGARIVVQPVPAPPSDVVPQQIPLSVLFEDEHLIVLMKPAGLVVHPAPGHPDGTLVNALRFHFGVATGDPLRPGIVHRLDRETSGVMVVTRSELAREGLMAQFKRHDIEREYLAIVHGHPPDEVRLDTLHGRHPVDRKRFSSRVARGKRAVTQLAVLERLHAASLVRCRLETGRTHQIRVHLAELGHPVLADALYGRGSADPRLRAAAEAISRQALHAQVLVFTHPITSERMSFRTEPPPDFGAALALLRDRR